MCVLFSKGWIYGTTSALKRSKTAEGMVAGRTAVLMAGADGVVRYCVFPKGRSKSRQVSEVVPTVRAGNVDGASCRFCGGSRSLQLYLL